MALIKVSKINAKFFFILNFVNEVFSRRYFIQKYLMRDVKNIYNIYKTHYRCNSDQISSKYHIFDALYQVTYY